MSGFHAVKIQSEVFWFVTSYSVAAPWRHNLEDFTLITVVLVFHLRDSFIRNKINTANNLICFANTSAVLLYR